MKKAADFRRLAREALSGKWVIAVLVCLVATLLGGVGSSGPEFTLNFDTQTGININLEYGNQVLFSTSDGVNQRLTAFLVGGAIAIFMITVIIGIARFILGSIVAIGYAQFNLELVDHKEPRFDTLFSSISNWKTAIVSALLQWIYVVLWTLLFIIPGIIASYNYAMTEFILAEHPELSASEAIARSKEMMKGNRWRLFCLDFSFIGWTILCSLTFGIGNLFLNPYIHAAKAAFYREISGTEYYYEEQVYDGVYDEQI